MKHGDLQTAFYVLDGALGRRKENVPRIEELIVQPALRFMTDRNDTRWIAGAWYLKSEDAILASPTKSTVDEVLRNLELVDRVEHHVEAVLKQVSKNFPREVIDLFVRRLENRSTRGDKIHPLPFELHKLREPLKAEINYLLETAKKLYASPDTATRYRATHLVRMVFPEFPAEVQDALEEKLESQDRGDLEFVVAMLREYESAEVVLDELSKAVIEAVPEDDELLGEVRVALLGTGLVAGPFGFVEAYKTKKLALEGWLKDPRAKVRDFAEKFISSLNNDIAAEQRSAEQDLAMRKLKYGDDEDGHEDDRS